MNEVLKSISTRYSCRSFTDQPVEQEKLEAIALSAVQAPSAMNKQPWKIIVIKDKSLLTEMDQAVMNKLAQNEDKTFYERMMSRGGKVLYNAPVMFVVAKKAGADLDTGIVTENIALAAHSLGLGNVICGMAREIFLTDKGDYFKEKIIPEGYELGMTVLVGYPTNPEGTPHPADTTKISYIG